MIFRGAASIASATCGASFSDSSTGMGPHFVCSASVSPSTGSRIREVDDLNQRQAVAIEFRPFKRVVEAIPIGRALRLFPKVLNLVVREATARSAR